MFLAQVPGEAPVLASGGTMSPRTSVRNLTAVDPDSSPDGLITKVLLTM